MSEIQNTPKRVWPSYVFGFVALALFLIGALVLLSFSGPDVDEGAARSEERTKAYEELQTENKKQLESFAWTDKEKGTVQIPIDLAVQLTIPRLQNQQPSVAGPITVPAPPPAPAPEAAPVGPETGVTPITEPAAPAPASTEPASEEPAAAELTPTGDSVTP